MGNRVWAGVATEQRAKLYLRIKPLNSKSNGRQRSREGGRPGVYRDAGGRGEEQSGRREGNWGRGLEG